MHERGQTSIEESAVSVAAAYQNNGAEDLIRYIETKSCKDAAYSAVFLGELPDCHTAGNPQNLQDDPQKRYDNKHKE